jgi:hypothetical protein
MQLMMLTLAICGLLVSQLLKPFGGQLKTLFGFAGKSLLERTFPRKNAYFFLYMYLDFPE